MGESKYCRFCGAEIPTGEALCPECGRPAKRSVGVSIISALSILGGVFFLVIGGINRRLVAVLMAAMVGGGLAGEAVAHVAVWFAMLFIMGPLLLVGGIGLWKLTAWGWWLSVIGLIIGLGSSGYTVVTGAQLWISGTALSIILGLIMGGYLVTKRKYFGIRF